MSDTTAGILTRGALLHHVRSMRRRRPPLSVVLANGLFDPLHVGHVRYLRAARHLGDFLVVAINDDRSARRLRGPGRPLIPVRDRARLVAALEGVGAVVVFGGATVEPLLRRLRPEVHCKGTDYTPKTVPERAVVRSYGGRVRIAGDVKRHASTELIRHLGWRAHGGAASPRNPRSKKKRSRGAPRRYLSSDRSRG